MLAAGEVSERIRAGAEIVVIVGEIGLAADHADLELSRAPALANARVENSGFLARIGPDDQQRVGLFDPRNGRIEDVARTSELRIEGVAALHRQIAAAVLAHEPLEREHLFDRGEIPGDSAHPLAVGHPDLGGDGCESLRPGRRAELAVIADIWPVEPLRAQAV